jgi:hypothetical protein
VAVISRSSQVRQVSNYRQFAPTPELLSIVNGRVFNQFQRRALHSVMAHKMHFINYDSKRSLDALANLNSGGAQ